MIGFVVPIKPKLSSKDWHLDNILLERTVKSICSQTNNQFRLFIVHNELPSINFVNDKITFVSFPFPSVKFNELEDTDYVIKYYNEDYAEKMFDKGRKITYGAKIAIENGCEYIMAIDSDDLISNKIADFVYKNSQSNPPGWRIKKGFIHIEGNRYLIKKYDIQNINGGTHIIRKDLVNIPDFKKNIFWNYNLFEAHGYTYFRLKDFNGVTLFDYPFFGIIYILGRNNYSDIRSVYTANRIKNFLKQLLSRKRVTNKILAEFGLYKLN